MAENYDLIFGQSASQQYAWSDSDYQNGWQTVGSTPPTAEQFDALQRRSDTKAQDLNNRLEPIESKSEADGRQAATSYTAGAMVTVDGLPNGWLLQCIVPGISGTDAITLPDILIDGLTIIDGDVTWALRKVATNGGLGYRQPNTAYTAGQIAYHASLPTGYYLECTTQGATSAGDITPSSTIGDTVTDGTVVWTVSISLSAYSGLMYNTKIKRENNTSYLGLTGGTGYGDGGSVYAYGKSAPTNPGRVEIHAEDAQSQTSLQVRPGELHWYPPGAEAPTDLGGSAIVAKSLGQNGYIKYASGVTRQWGVLSGTAPQSTTTKEYSISLPISFATRITDFNFEIIDSPEGYATGRKITYRLCLRPLRVEITVPSNTNLGFVAYFDAIGY